MVVINRNNHLNTAFNFQLTQPSCQLAAFVQGIWSASVHEKSSIERPLYSDAGSGIMFNFSGNVTIGGETLPEGVIMLPIKKQANSIILPAGARLAGIRFLPAIGYGILGKNYYKPTFLKPEDDEIYNLYEIYHLLSQKHSSEDLIDTIYQWAIEHLDFTNVIPSSLEKALEHIEQDEALAQLNTSTDLSQRQVERMFKLWLGMTPKHYQRILRIKKALCFLRVNTHANLAEVAINFGFSDQAHMTREFRTIACITPGQLHKTFTNKK